MSISRLRQFLRPLERAHTNSGIVALTSTSSTIWNNKPTIGLNHSGPVLTLIRTATKRAAGSRTSMKDSAGRRLGMKRSDGEPVKAGQIIYRQRGTRFYPGENADIGKDHTIWAKEPGFVRYYYDPFHPKRRLIGVALSVEDKLPTPHFEPRKRRLGYVPLTNEKYIAQEKEWLSRKETLALPKILVEVEKREQARSNRALQLLNSLKSLIDQELLARLNEEEEIASQVSKRLVTISNYLAGGRTLDEARNFTDAEFIQDTRLAGELGKISQEVADSKIKNYQELTSRIDSLVSFDADRNLIKFYTESELSTMKKESLKQLTELCDSVQRPLSDAMKDEINQILRKPCFDLSERVKYRRKFIRPEPPSLIKNKETLLQMEKLVKSGKGTIVQSWNYNKRKVDRFFLPTGTSMFAIH